MKNSDEIKDELWRMIARISEINEHVQSGLNSTITEPGQFNPASTIVHDFHEDFDNGALCVVEQLGEMIAEIERHWKVGGFYA